MRPDKRKPAWGRQSVHRKFLTIGDRGTLLIPKHHSSNPPNLVARLWRFTGVGQNRKESIRMWAKKVGMWNDKVTGKSATIWGSMKRNGDTTNAFKRQMNDSTPTVVWWNDHRLPGQWLAVFSTWLVWCLGCWMTWWMIVHDGYNKIQYYYTRIVVIMGSVTICFVIVLLHHSLLRVRLPEGFMMELTANGFIHHPVTGSHKQFVVKHHQLTTCHPCDPLSWTGKSAQGVTVLNHWGWSCCQETSCWLGLMGNSYCRMFMTEWVVDTWFGGGICHWDIRLITIDDRIKHQ